MGTIILIKYMQISHKFMHKNGKKIDTGYNM